MRHFIIHPKKIVSPSISELIVRSGEMPININAKSNVMHHSHTHTHKPPVIMEDLSVRL